MKNTRQNILENNEQRQAYCFCFYEFIIGKTRMAKTPEEIVFAKDNFTNISIFHVENKIKFVITNDKEEQKVFTWEEVKKWCVEVGII